MSMATDPPSSSSSSSLHPPPSNSNEITQIQADKPQNIPSSSNNTSSPPEESTHNNKTTGAPQSLVKLLSSDLSYIDETCKKLNEYREHVDDQLIKNARNKLEALKGTIDIPIEADEGIEDELRKFKKSVRKLKLLIPSKFKINYSELQKDPNLRFDSSAQGKQEDTLKQRGIMPNFYKNSLFMHSVAFRDFDSLYHGLGLKEKLSLLCFSVFPRGAIIKKRLMVYWWVSEGFTTEEEMELVGNLFNKFVDKALIIPVNEKHRPLEQVGSCKMHPFVRSAVIMFAERAKFFDYDVNGNPTEDYTSSFRSCLTGKGLSNFDKLESLHMLFNVDEAILEFRTEWLMKMKNVNILYLGRWKASGKHHIEVEDTEFLQGLKYMKFLMFLSLQGISRITELPNSISKLRRLTILDLRACHNLEVVPDEIGSLQSLKHLDMSECYLLEHMPKQLSLLKNLVVLKGFVVRDSVDRSACTLDQLAKLQNLKKLSIYTKMEEFPDDKHLSALRHFKVLTKLTIAWGGGTKSAREIGNETGGSSKTREANSRAEGNPNQEIGENNTRNQEAEAKLTASTNRGKNEETGGNSKICKANSTAKGNQDQETGEENTRNQEPETKPTEGKNRGRNQETGGNSKTREANSSAEGNLNQETGENNTRNQEAKAKPTAGTNKGKNEETGGNSKIRKADSTAEGEQDQEKGGKNTRNQEPETKPTEGRNRGMNQETGGNSKTPEANSRAEGNLNQETGENNTRNQEAEAKPTAGTNKGKNEEPGGNSKTRKVNSTAEGNQNQETGEKSTINQEPQANPTAGKNRGRNQETGGNSKTCKANSRAEGNLNQETGVNNTGNQEAEAKPTAGTNKGNNEETGGKSRTCKANSTAEGNQNQETGGKSTRNQEPEAKQAVGKNRGRNQETEGNSKTREANSTAEGDPKIETGLPKKLVKLDLQCFSGKLAPTWLKPGDLKMLKKLYIRGGELHYLRRWPKEETWKVETLRLKYLSELEMGWKELHSLFPELIYLEKVKCPKLTLFPCDAFGVWINKKKIRRG